MRLLPKDLDRTAGTPTVLRGKGGRRRTIGVDPGAFAVVERWLDVRAKLVVSNRAPAAASLHGGLRATASQAALEKGDHDLPRLPSGCHGEAVI